MPTHWNVPPTDGAERTNSEFPEPDSSTVLDRFAPSTRYTG